MRLKALSLFLAIQVLSFGIWHSLSHAESPVLTQASAIQATETTPVHSASVTPQRPSLPSLPTVPKNEEPELMVHFSSKNMSEKSRFLNAIKENQIGTALRALPSEHAQTVKDILIDYNPDIRRGMGGNNRIILRGVNMGAAELIAVLIHEVGHNVDYGYLSPSENSQQSAFMDGRLPLYESDASLDFYRISWLNEGKKKSAATDTDFVSGYAMSDCFEDFAESYTFYILHNKDFKRLAASSEALYAKYRYMKYEVFDGREFDTGDGVVTLEGRPWDITALDYNYSEFLS